MTDKITQERRSENMRRIRSKNTSPELIVRKLTHRLGYRFRLHRKDLPGKPDLTFPSKRKVIFVHGCFWHQHDAPNCKIARVPRSNTDYWLPKLHRNVERDKQHQHQLEELGWKYLVLWECEIRDLGKLEQKIVDFFENKGV